MAVISHGRDRLSPISPTGVVFTKTLMYDHNSLNQPLHDDSTLLFSISMDKVYRQYATAITSNTNKHVARLTLVLLFSALTSCAHLAAPQPPGLIESNRSRSSLEFQSCMEMYQLEGNKHSCGYLKTPENYGDASSRSIKVPFLIIFPDAKDADFTLTPLLVTGGGGPGSPQLGNKYYGISSEEHAVYEAFSARDGRTLVILENRGVGLSQPLLECHYPSELLELDYWSALIKTDELCGREHLNNGTDLSQYNTHNAALDIEMFRQLYQMEGVNTQQLNLYGISYGTHIAMHYERLFPDKTRTMVLDSVVNNETQAIINLDNQFEYGQRALDSVFEKCRSSLPCRETLGAELESEFYTFLTGLKSANISINAAWPKGPESISIPLSGSLVVSTLHSALYSGETIAAVPLIIRNLIDGTYDLFVKQLNSDLESYSLKDTFSDTAFLTYLCYDQDYTDSNGRFFHNDKLFKYWDMESNRQHMLHICSNYGIEANTSWDSEEYTSSTPTLMLSGELDPVTPQASATEAAEKYSYHWNFVFDDVAHDVISHSKCAQELASWFIYHVNEDLNRRFEECEPHENKIIFELE